MGNRCSKTEAENLIPSDDQLQWAEEDNPFHPRHYDEMPTANGIGQMSSGGLAVIVEADEKLSPVAGGEIDFQPVITVEQPSPPEASPEPSTSGLNGHFFPGQITLDPRLSFSGSLSGSLRVPDTIRDESWAQRMNKFEQWSAYYMRPTKVLFARFWTDDHPKLPTMVSFSRYWPVLFLCGLGLYFIGVHMLEVHAGRRVDLYRNKNPKLRWIAGNYCKNIAVVLMSLSGFIFVVGMLIYSLFSRDQKRYYTSEYIARLQREEFRKVIYSDSGCGDGNGFYGTFSSDNGWAINTEYRPHGSRRREGKPGGKRDEMEESGCYDNLSYQKSLARSTGPLGKEMGGATCEEFDVESVDLSNDSFRNPNQFDVNVGEKASAARLIRYNPNHQHKDQLYSSDEIEPYYPTEKFRPLNGKANFLHVSDSDSDSS